MYSTLMVTTQFITDTNTSAACILKWHIIILFAHYSDVTTHQETSSNTHLVT